MRILYFFILLSFSFGSALTAAAEQADIFPDYSGVTLPPNIAPMDFYIRNPAKAYQVKIRAAQGETLEISGSKPEIIIPETKWKKLLEQNAGQELYWDIALKDESGSWRNCETITNRIAKEPLDSWLAYRLMRSIFNTYNDMGIYQRNLETFEEKEILHNSRIEGACLNCHQFQKNSPEQMTFHVRLPKIQHPIVRVRENAPVEVLRKTFTYYSWNPETNVIAYTANGPSIFFHTWGEGREVYDKAGEVGILNLDTHKTTSQPALATEHYYESWPSWDNKGEYLYFCRAPDLPQSKFNDIRFDLLRARWDPASSHFSEAEMLFSGWTNRVSTAQPRVSPDGKFLAYTVFERGNFPVYQPSADIWLMDLESREIRSMEHNSDKADTWHCWSSNGRWMVFSSKRIDGVLARPHFAYMDAGGHASKPFVLPQKDPHFYEYFIKTYNIPELITGTVKSDPKELGRAVMSREHVVKVGTTDGGKNVEKEQPPEEGYSSFKEQNK